jgi:hypothetical protein
VNKEEKAEELVKYRSLILAAVDYSLKYHAPQMKLEGFDFVAHYESLKVQTDEHFRKGRLTVLKNWFRDLIEMPLEEGDLKFNQFLIDRTGYEVDIFKAHYQRIERIVAKGKITTDRQYYEVNQMVDQLCQIFPVDSAKIAVLNKMLAEYGNRKAKSNPDL